jgi:hypothetical protein
LRENCEGEDEKVLILERFLSKLCPLGIIDEN